MEVVRTAQEYSRAEVRRILKITENRLRSWERHGLSEPRNEFGFRDLVALRTLKSLRESRVPNARIKESVRSLRSKLDGVEQPLSELKLWTNGRRVAVELPNVRMEAISGQLLLAFEGGSKVSVETLHRSAGAPLEECLREAEHWFQKGLALEETGAESAEIAASYRQAVELNPNAAGAWVNIGTLCYRDGDLKEAERCYREALRVAPDYALAHFNLGNICEEAGRLGESADYYEEALRLRPGYADAHYNIALVYERRGELMQAAKHWRAYLRLDSAGPWAGIARQQLSGLLQVTEGGRSGDDPLA